MNKLLFKNILYSGLDQFILILCQFLGGIIIIRNIPREQYGLLGIVAGYFVIYNLFNISLEAIILRDHKIYNKNLSEKLGTFLSFSYWKAAFMLVISIPLAFFLYYLTSNFKVFYAVGISYTVLAGQALIGSITTLYSAKFKQKIVTKISVFKSILRLILLLGLFYFQDIYYFFYVELVTTILLVVVWYFNISKNFGIKVFSVIRFKTTNWVFIKKSFLNYSLWTHLNGVVTQFIYRSDTFFLSFFVGIVDIGNYNVALNSSNIANILPSIFGYQNSVALSNTKNKNQIEEITSLFIRLSLYMGFVTLIIFIIFGGVYLRVLTGDDEVSNMFIYQIFIVSGLVISKTFASPIVSLINIHGDVKDVFKRVSIPIFGLVLFTYFFSSKYFGTTGIAIANVFNSIIWLVLLFYNFKKYHFNINLKIKPINDFISLKAFMRND